LDVRISIEVTEHNSVSGVHVFHKWKEQDKPCAKDKRGNVFPEGRNPVDGRTRE